MRAHSGPKTIRWVCLVGAAAGLALGPAACDAPGAPSGASVSATDGTSSGNAAQEPSGGGSGPAIPHPADLATQISASFGVDDLRTHAQAIVEHERPSGSEGENAAIDYIVNTLTNAGVPVSVDEFEAYVSTPVSASLRVVGSDYSPAAITIAYSAAADSVVAELIDVGELADLPELEVGTGEVVELVGQPFPDVSGKIALVTGQPRGGPTSVLQALGAVAVVFANPEERVNDLIVTSTWGSPSLRNHHRLPQLPVAHVPKSAGDSLRALARRRSVRVQLDVEVDTGWKTLRLAVARIEPEGRSRAPYVLFGGHIDAWYHGGTDEGASNAAMVSLAQAFHANRAHLRRGLVVAWWPGHSNGRYAGSTWFADQYSKELRERAIAYVNVDGIGQRGASRHDAATTASLARLARSVVVDGAGVPIDPSRPGTNSDQSFNGIGLPLLQLYHNRSAEDGGTWWWHTPEDTFDKIDFGVLKADADLYAAALSSLMASAVLPVDLVAQAEAAGEALARRADEADGHLEFAAARAAHIELARAFAELQALCGHEDAASTVALDTELVGVLRPLHRVLYVEGSPYHPDVGRSPGPLPGLSPASILNQEEPASDRFRFAATTLTRELNRVVEAFTEAARRAEALTRKIKEAGVDDD